MRRDEKETVVSELSARLKSAKAIIVAEYRGLKVSQLSGVRREVRKNEGEIRVVKNRLAKLATKGTAWEPLHPHLKGPIMIAMSDRDPVVLSKILAKAATDFELLKLKAGALDGRLLSAKDIEGLSKLPSKEELYSKLLGTLLAPAQGVVRTLQGVPQKLAMALKAIAEKK